MKFYIPEHPFSFDCVNVPHEKVKYYNRLAAQEALTQDKHYADDPVAVLRAQASLRRWRALAESSDQTLNDRLLGDAVYGIQALLVRADGHSEEAVRMLYALATTLLDGLFAVAANDEKPVAKVWFRALIRSTLNLNFLLYHRTEIFLPALKEECSVPAPISPSPESVSRNKELLDRLEAFGLGRGVNIGLPKAKGQGKRFSYKKPDNLLALNLFAHIDDARERWKVWNDLSESTKSELRIEKECTASWLAKAIVLEPLNPKNYDSWFEVAWEIVTEAANNDPGNDPSLISILTKHEKKSSVTFAVAIHRKLRDAFKEMVKACH